MRTGVLERLLADNDRHVERLAESLDAEVVSEREPPVVSVCCTDAAVPQPGPWRVGGGQLYTSTTMGNQVWDADVGETIVDSGILFPLHHRGAETIAIVGHTKCWAVKAAYNFVTGGQLPSPLGVEKRIELLVPVVEQALDSEAVWTNGSDGAEDLPEAVLNQLVEFNVHHQVDYLDDAPEIPDDVTLLGFVYDALGVVGNRGRAYLVNVDGERDPEKNAEMAPAQFEEAVVSFLR